MLRVNLENPNFEFHPGCTDLDVTLAETGGSHSFSFKAAGARCLAVHGGSSIRRGAGGSLPAGWGSRVRAKIRHGAHFFWVEGLVDIEKLTNLSPQQIRTRLIAPRSDTLPRGRRRTTFALRASGSGPYRSTVRPVLDSSMTTNSSRVTAFDTIEKLIDWVCEEFPLFARDLPYRRVLHHTALKDFATTASRPSAPRAGPSPARPARFTDPLYSPGGDLISLYNTFITDAVQTKTTPCWQRSVASTSR